jgi:hypothetical protein
VGLSAGAGFINKKPALAAAVRQLLPRGMPFLLLACRHPAVTPARHAPSGPACAAGSLSKNLYVEAVPLGFLINLLLGFREFLDLVFDMLDAFNDSSQLIARNSHPIAHGLLLVNMTPQKSAI